MESASDRVTRSVRLDVDLDAAWRLIGTQEGLARWLGHDLVLDPSAGAGLRLRDDEGVERTGRVVEVEDGRRLAFEWADGDGATSTVTLGVEADGEGGSRVTVVEERSGGSLAAHADIGAAWDHRMLHLELGALTTCVPAFAGRGVGELVP